MLTSRVSGVCRFHSRDVVLRALEFWCLRFVGLDALCPKVQGQARGLQQFNRKGFGYILHSLYDLNLAFWVSRLCLTGSSFFGFRCGFRPASILGFKTASDDSMALDICTRTLVPLVCRNVRCAEGFSLNPFAKNRTGRFCCSNHLSPSFNIRALPLAPQR